MRIRVIALTMLAFLFAGSIYGQTCDRACLNGFVDLYWSALVAHDPDRLPLTPNARYTENGQTLKAWRWDMGSASA